MFNFIKEGIILHKTDLTFENESVLNPAIMQEGDTLHMFYRAVRHGNFSTIGYCRLHGPMNVVDRMEEPLLSPLYDYESHGIEDPRIVKIDDLYYLTYTAYDGANAMGALATSKDLVTFERHGIITPQISHEEFQKLAESNCALNEKYKRFYNYNKNAVCSEVNLLLWDKNVIFFPKKINNKFYFLHRIKPDIQIACVDSIDNFTSEFWENYLSHFEASIILSPKYEHEISYIGGGCPPIETEVGWLLIYHGVCDTAEGYIYSACVALMDLENPAIEIARLPYPLFRPQLEWELKGYVNNVVFPTGTATFGNTLYIYYGAADQCIAVASLHLDELLKELLIHKRNRNE